MLNVSNSDVTIADESLTSFVKVPGGQYLKSCMKSVFQCTDLYRDRGTWSGSVQEWFTGSSHW